MDNQNDNEKKCPVACTDLNWWAMLVVAVLAVPSLGIIIAIMSGTKGFFSVAIFIVTCWISTYLGMRLMKARDSRK